jgi:hypothetical protein
MKNNELVPGDIGLTRSNGFISKAIRYFMDKYRKKLGLPKRDLYSHAFMIVKMWDRLFVAEAEAEGIRVKPFEEVYPSSKWVNKNIKILTPKKAYNSNEIDTVSKIAVAYALEPTRYGYADLLFHAKAIMNKDGYDSWKGKKGEAAEKRLHCSEAVATWANKVRPKTFNRPWSTNPLDLDLNTYYKEKVI